MAQKAKLRLLLIRWMPVPTCYILAPAGKRKGGPNGIIGKSCDTGMRGGRFGIPRDGRIGTTGRARSPQSACATLQHGQGETAGWQAGIQLYAIQGRPRGLLRKGKTLRLHLV